MINAKNQTHEDLGLFSSSSDNKQKIMSSLLSYLPPFEGLLPKWLFLVH